MPCGPREPGQCLRSEVFHLFRLVGGDQAVYDFVDIPVQEAVRQGGGNNAASIKTALVGDPSIVCGVPVRYAHATNCISSGFDYEAAVQMVIALLENITEDVIRSI